VILLILQRMLVSPDEETQELAQRLKSQIFYEEGYLLMLSGLCRTFHNKLLCKEFLECIVECYHILLAILEDSDKAQEAIVVRKKNAAKKTGEESDEDVASKQYADSSEKFFAFARFEGSFANADTINLQSQLLAHFEGGLSAAYIEYIVSMFKRISENCEKEPLFFKASTLSLFNKIASSRVYRTLPFKPLAEFIRKITTSFVKKIQLSPLVFLEVYLYQAYSTDILP
jgi:hypothetical protein